MATEKRLIDANEALRMMRNSKSDNPCINPTRKGVWNVAHDCAISCVDACPTVDAVEVVHGRWIPTYHTYYNREGASEIADEWHCSECGIYSRSEPNYCPNCGAKMDRGTV